MNDKTFAAEAPARLELKNISKVFSSAGKPDFTAVENATLDIEPGEFVTLLGPSGCGKTTNLRMIAGFETPTTGQILLDGKDIVSMPPNRRPMSMVFQSYALFPHMNVEQNIAFGLQVGKVPKDQLAKRVARAMEAMGIEEYAQRAPHELSGGQQQRVALARALVMEPKVLLFDEPLSNLDAKLREQMRMEIRRIQQEFGITSLFVTHDQDEAMTMSDKIVVMSRGRIEQVGTPQEVYNRPDNKFVASFLGTANFFPLCVEGVTDAADGSGARMVDVSIGNQSFCVKGSHLIAEDATQALMLVRAENIGVEPAGYRAVEGQPVVEGTVMTSVFHGYAQKYQVDAGFGEPVAVSVPGNATVYGPGEQVSLIVDPKTAWCVPLEKA